ncbi:para-nitrobenzyl esterase-like [Clavelina lepadiformis]|uniref:para-nitrobenzyl esterase-like n=1 Tax=Clavelina lepadiformis TaxID=159417 RepID=UPI0040421BAA
MKFILRVVVFITSVISVISVDPFFAGFEEAFRELSEEPDLKSVRYHLPNQLEYEPDEEPIAHPKVQTTSGLITGAAFPGCTSFYSVPYAKPPVGDLRFQEPQMAEDHGPLDKSTPDYVSCVEFSSNLLKNKKTVSKILQKEDCLVLNVHVPSTIDLNTSPNKKLPVMFWIHGGAYSFGSGTSMIYDGQKFSQETNTVVVTINYRLGPLGFLVFKKSLFTFEGGNQAMKDQQLALKWVQENIGNFGGDKNMVTIFGESAGGQSVMFHLLSEQSNPLFKRAIMQSNPAVFPYLTRVKYFKETTKLLLNGLKCSPFALPAAQLLCLKEATVSNLLKAHKHLMDKAKTSFLDFDLFRLIEPFRPILDGKEITASPLDLFQSGKWNKDKEVIIGTLSQELAVLKPIVQMTGLKKLPRLLFRTITTAAVGVWNAGKVMQQYEQFAVDGDYTEAFVQEALDMFFACPTRAVARAMSQTSGLYTPPVYLYVNQHPLAGDLCKHLSLPESFCGYAFHGSDVLFVFDVEAVTGDTLSDSDKVIVKLFSKFWGNFAYHGSPTTDATEWPRYVSNAQKGGTVNAWSNIRLKAPNSSVESGYKEEFCDFWDNLDIYRGWATSMESSDEHGGGPSENQEENHSHEDL